ncbi:MAG: chromosome partitioning protein ParA, partial [Muribaculaceae bacterium]|nr:chromosome partitioning protein ParA [Muribaculaceae bacterium]
MESSQYTPENEKENTGAEDISFYDIMLVTINHWQWLVLSLVLCLGLAYLYILCTPKIYTRSAEIIIKEQSKGQTSGMEDFATLGLFQGKTNIFNEMAVLQAKDIMAQVVERLNLDYNYYSKGLFYNHVLYGTNLPYTVNFPEMEPSGKASFQLTVSPEGNVTITDFETDNKEFENPITGHLNDTIATPAGPLVVSASPTYEAPAPSEDEEAAETKGPTDVTILVRKTTLKSAQSSFSGRLGVEQKEEKGTVITLTLTDQSIERADDVLASVIGVYNESWIRDKNQIAVSTSNFINERLSVIESELGNVDSDISTFKSEHLVPDVQAASSMYMNENQRTSSAIVELNNQLQMKRYISSYLSAKPSTEELLPVNTGINSPVLTQQIAEYNKNVLQRNGLAQKSSDKNPLVQNLDKQILAQREAIIKTVENQMVDLQTQIQ